MARALVAPDDWLLSLDADETLSESGDPSTLANQPLDVAEGLMWDREYDGLFPIRRLFRALRGITVERAHNVVMAEKNGRLIMLSGNPSYPLEEAFVWPEVRIEHRSSERSVARKLKKEQYNALAGPMEQQALRDSRVSA